ncbi:MAG: hypothetical protein FD135_3499 [Comamonadaceae bacterium]|nr:MAG: hypothetical protein FD135_3499 [Comamonadaceae bacterium]
MDTTIKRRRIGISIDQKPVGWIGTEDGFLVSDAAKGLRRPAAIDADGYIYYGYESALRSVDMRYSSISLQTLEAHDESMQYRAVQGEPNGFTISYQKHSFLRNQIERYKAKGYSKPCANEAEWSQAA